MNTNYVIATLGLIIDRVDILQHEPTIACRLNLQEGDLNTPDGRDWLMRLVEGPDGIGTVLNTVVYDKKIIIELSCELSDKEVFAVAAEFVKRMRSQAKKLTPDERISMTSHLTIAEGFNARATSSEDTMFWASGGVNGLG